MFFRDYGKPATIQLPQEALAAIEMGASSRRGTTWPLATLTTGKRCSANRDSAMEVWFD